MAEEDKPAEESQKTSSAGLGLKEIGIIVVIVIVTQVVMKFTLDALFPPQYVDPATLAEEEAEAEEEETPVEDLGPANYLPLDPALVVNVQQNGESQYLQASVQLMTRDPDVYEAAKLHAPAIRSALIMLFGTVDVESLATVEGKMKLQDDARQRIDEVLEELAGVSGVDAVYLTSLVFQ